MAKYAYPAIFTPEEGGSFSIVFPDLESCYTCGDSLSDGIEMAEDALALVLYGYEKDGREIPSPCPFPVRKRICELECVRHTDIPEDVQQHSC